MSIDAAIATILRHEGGYVDHPADRGGPTKYGVTLATLRRERENPGLTAEDVRALTRAEAAAIFQRRYYLEPGLDRLPDPIRPFIFDCSVHHGPRRAVKFVQRVCAETVGHLAVDGLIGALTQAAAQQAEARMDEWFLAALIEERLNFFKMIIRHDPGQRVFAAGWRTRALSYWPSVIPRHQERQSA